MENFSENLKKLRKQKKITQSMLAEYCNLSVRQVIRYEQGISEPTLSVLLSLSIFFEISIDELSGKIPLKTKDNTKNFEKLFEKLSSNEQSTILLILETMAKNN